MRRPAGVLIFGFSLVVLLGALLRLYGVADQVLLDDEWHGMYYAVGKSFGYLLTHFSVPGATCIPLNLHCLLLLRTVGWNEVLLRLPSLAAGLLSLVALPVLAGRLFGVRRSLLFASLLAISPFLVFYSRVCRPYSLVVLLAPAAFFSACLWMTNGKVRYAVQYVLFGVGAVYCHLFAAPVVAAPLACGFLLRRLRPAPRPRTLLAASAAMAALLGLLVLPALIDSVRTTLPSLVRTDRVTAATLRGGASLLSGTSNPVLTALFLALAGWGVWGVIRRTPLIGWMFVCVPILYAATMAASAPDSVHSPMVLSRYLIPIFPLAAVLVASGIDELLGRLERRSGRPSSGVVRGLLSASLPAALFVAGPLVHLYASGSNFMNHAAFQQSYESHSWDESFTRDMAPATFTADLTVGREQISAFYAGLANDGQAKAIIEYPMPVGDHCNLLYYYQHFHGKRVIVGYVTDFPMRRTAGAGLHVYGNTYVDEVLGLVGDARKLRFRNMIDMEDIEKLRRCPARYVIVHRRYEADLPLVCGATPSLERLERIYRESFGEPFYEDAHLIAFRIQPQE